MGAPDKYNVVVGGRWTEVDIKSYVHPYSRLHKPAPNPRKERVRNGNSKLKIV